MELHVGRLGILTIEFKRKQAEMQRELPSERIRPYWKGRVVVSSIDGKLAALVTSKGLEMQGGQTESQLTGVCGDCQNFHTRVMRGVVDTIAALETTDWKASHKRETFLVKYAENIPRYLSEEEQQRDYHGAWVDRNIKILYALQSAIYIPDRHDPFKREDETALADRRVRLSEGRTSKEIEIMHLLLDRADYVQEKNFGIKPAKSV